MAGPFLAGGAVVCLTAGCLAQDSIVVVDRGAPPPAVWAVVEAPFKLLEIPFRLVGAGVGWVAGRAEAGGWVPALRRAKGALEARGVRPWVAGQGPNSGIGPELRVGPAGPPVWLYVRGAVTAREYWQIEGRAGGRLPGRGSPLSLEAFAALEDRPKDTFFGIGNGSREADRSDYALRRRSTGARLTVEGARRLLLRLAVDWARVETGPGTDNALPDIDSAFAPAERPGFGATHRFLSVGASAEWAAGARHAVERRGSWATLGYRWRGAATPGVADVHLVSAGAGVELPFDHRRRSVVLALYVESLRPASSGEVPFHLLPTLGGAQSLPAFRADRFRDRAVLLGKLEYRWRVWSDPGGALWVDAALLTSGGMVAARLGHELAWSRLHGTSGFALALITREAAVARFGLSRGADGVGVTLALGSWF